MATNNLSCRGLHGTTTYTTSLGFKSHLTIKHGFDKAQVACALANRFVIETVAEDSTKRQRQPNGTEKDLGDAIEEP